ncbi:MAG TPA: hypothetical protein EYG03_14770 [Planctomycetes bacterium]|nr:hypothetical protein [Fuerstiella sp.]HIK93223.1 hypothetical protein [Planctomycetota bacterium]
MFFLSELVGRVHIRADSAVAITTMSDGCTLYALPAEWQVVQSGTDECSNDSTLGRLTDWRVENL